MVYNHLWCHVSCSLCLCDTEKFRASKIPTQSVPEHFMDLHTRRVEEIKMSDGANAVEKIDCAGEHTKACDCNCKPSTSENKNKILRYDWVRCAHTQQKIFSNNKFKVGMGFCAISDQNENTRHTHTHRGDKTNCCLFIWKKMRETESAKERVRKTERVQWLFSTCKLDCIRFHQMTIQNKCYVSWIVKIAQFNWVSRSLFMRLLRWINLPSPLKVNTRSL